MIHPTDARNQQLLMSTVILAVSKQLTPEQAQAAAADIRQQAEAKAKSDESAAALLNSMADAVVAFAAGR